MWSEGGVGFVAGVEGGEEVGGMGEERGGGVEGDEAGVQGVKPDLDAEFLGEEWEECEFLGCFGGHGEGLRWEE